MELSERLAGAIALALPWIRPKTLGAPTLAVKPSIVSFRKKPASPATLPVPKRRPSEYVTDTALPAWSTIE
ncbi:hypothetical protein G6F57_022602 [Rhizopus arrhizus]|nr:hypothetical protein G6F57_022602 [Rhizopus arrhizus]